MIRVVVTDDDAAIRDVVSAFLDAQEEIDVVGRASDGREAVELVRALTPDVVVMDIEMPVLDGLEATRAIKAEHANVAVLLLTSLVDPAVADAGARAGADGFHLKSVFGAELVDRVRELAEQ